MFRRTFEWDALGQLLRVLDRRDHKEAPERPLWRYRTEPKIPQADRWSVTYGGTVGRDHT